MEEEESQGNDSKIFSVRIVSIDFYMSPPISDFDISYSSFQGGGVKEVPVIRIYGSTPAGQKSCIHVHRVLPYLYVPCSEIPLQANLEGVVYENAVCLAVEKALKLKGNAGSKRQHVYGCSVVRAKKFYGYHSTEELFIKLYLYYPHDVSRAASLLLDGAVFEKSVQPYEAHIPFLLQFMVDYNLYGMGHMHLGKMKFRHPVPNDFLRRNPGHSIQEYAFNRSSDSQADAIAGSGSGALVWNTSTILEDWMWQYPTEPGSPSIYVCNIVKRQSLCEIEGDTTVDDILNQQLKVYTSLSQTLSDVKMVQSLIPIWEEELERSGVHYPETLADPGKPLPQDVLRTLFNNIEYGEKLRELYFKAESTLCTMSEDGKPGVSAQCLVQERSPGEVGSQKSDKEASIPSEKTTIGSQPSACGDKGAEPEDVALLKWLASSQAAEDINSDDELRRETIISPLVPAATIDKVLEKANTDYESESQQECQDILDSVLDLLHCDENKQKGPSSSHDKGPQALLNTRIPQLDGSGDDQLSTPAANSSKEAMEWVPSKDHSVPGTSSFQNKRRTRKMQWGPLPFSKVQSICSDVHSGSASMNESDTYSGETKDETLVHASLRRAVHGVSDNSAKDADNSLCNLVDSKPLNACSMRDLMRKKRCLRVGSSECDKSEVAEVVSKQKTYTSVPRKLEFHSEHSGENMQDFEVSVSTHGQVIEQKELSERQESSACCGSGKKDTSSSLVNVEEKGTVSVMASSKGYPSHLTTSDLAAENKGPKLSDDDCTFVSVTLKLPTVSCSSSLSESKGKGRLCLEAEDSGKCRSDLESRASPCNQMGSQIPDIMSVASNERPHKVGSIQHRASGSQELGSTYCLQNEEQLGCTSMTFHKKPPVANWTNGASKDSMSVLAAQSNCSILEHCSDIERISVRGQISEDVLPFFVDTCEGISKQMRGCGDLYQKFSLGVPTHHRNDGSFAYLLTPAVSPPSVGSVLNWLTLTDKEKNLNESLPESSCGLEAADQFLREEINSHTDQKTKSKLSTIGDPMSDVLSSCSDERSPVNVKEASKSSQEISQISGPSGQSKPTPLSQMGFKDPASIGAGQQLTLLSIEILAESRGDLRPDPQHDAINIIALAVQNDGTSSADIHVLLRSESQAGGRNVDGYCKLLIHPDEMSLLDQFISMIHSMDPDILMGWDVQGSSLGYLAERASWLGVSLLSKISRIQTETKAVKCDQYSSVKGNNDPISSDSLISDTSLHDDKIIEDEWGRTHASGVHISGRIVLNVWRLVRGEVKLNLYTLEAVVEAVLRRKVPSIQWKFLNKWFSSGPAQARFRCIDYVAERAKLNHEIVNQLDMINRTSELARVFGIDFFSVLSRGSQYRVESMLIRLAHTQNYVLISPGRQQVASQPAMECIPLVMEPESGFYSDPVIVLDFQSLYPSMIIAYNLCFSTCLGNVAPSKADILGVCSYSQDLHILKDLKLKTLVTPNGVMYVPSEVRRGILPRLLDEILSTRIMVKQAMKKLAASQQILHRIFNARQLALKLIANVTYGYTAAGFSGRMPCAELADSIVQCGRRTLEHAISVVNTCDKWNARVIYGDTDSMFVLLKGRSMKEAFEIGSDIASTITAMNPNPVTLKMEKVYQSCFLLTKKRYVGYSYESLHQPKPIFDAKGIETVRRDTCAAVAKTLEKSLRMFFEHQDITKVRDFLQRQWSKILSGRVSIQDFVFAKEVRLGTYSARTSSSLPPAAIVASKAMRTDPRAEPRYAERVPYVVVHGEPGARLVDMVVDPHELLAIESPYRLNDLYYITKQIIPALQRVFGLLGVDLNQWFREMPRPVRDAPTKHHFNAANSLRARIDHYYSSRHCVLCGELVQAASRLCGKCHNNGPFTAAAMTGRTAKLERDIQHLVAICRHCGGGDWVVETGVKCTSLACAVYYERVKVQKELRAFSSIATEAGFYPKCMVEWF